MTKILIIEDEFDIQEILRRTVHTCGHQHVIVSDGGEAVKQAVDPEIKLILSDLRMPGTPSGIDLIKQLRQLRPDCPIVVVTGYADDSVIEECQKLGVTDVLAKPFELPFIQSIILKLVPHAN